MEAVVTIGLDIAKSVFQVHGVDGSGAVIVRRRLTRGKVLSFFEKRRPGSAEMTCDGAPNWPAKVAVVRPSACLSCIRAWKAPKHRRDSRAARLR